MNAGNVTGIATMTGPGTTIYNGTSWTSGWGVSISGNNITLTKPIAKRALNAQTHAVNGANVFSVAFINKTTATMSCVQPASFASVTFNAISGTNTGAATSGATTVDITFQMEA
jgi:hypothetical protein